MPLRNLKSKHLGAGPAHIPDLQRPETASQAAQPGISPQQGLQKWQGADLPLQTSHIP